MFLPCRALCYSNAWISHFAVHVTTPCDEHHYHPTLEGRKCSSERFIRLPKVTQHQDLNSVQVPVLKPPCMGEGSSERLAGGLWQGCLNEASKQPSKAVFPKDLCDRPGKW